MKYLYFLLCKFYGFIVTNLEKKFLLKKKINNSFDINLNGFEILKEGINTQVINNEKEIITNKYTIKRIVTEKSLLEFLEYLFIEKNLAKKITERTNYEYSIDFFTNYQISHIPENDISGDWYANKWHNDKPFSDNTLKIIIPLNDTSSGNYGGIQILNLDDSKKLNLQNNENNFLKYFEMKSSLDQLLIFFPKLCYHKAGNPMPNLKRDQIMLQLNPAKVWCINSKIYKKQFNIEPKFPLINYMLEKKINLNIN